MKYLLLNYVALMVAMIAHLKTVYIQTKHSQILDYGIKNCINIIYVHCIHFHYKHLEINLRKFKFLNFNNILNASMSNCIFICRSKVPNKFNFYFYFRYQIAVCEIIFQWPKVS